MSSQNEHGYLGQFRGLQVEKTEIQPAFGAVDGFDRFDIVNAGYHYGLPRGYMTTNYIYWHAGLPAGSTAQLRNKNTDMALRALYENDIFLLTHLGDKGPFDMRALCKACEETEVLRPFMSILKNMLLAGLGATIGCFISRT